MAVKLRLRRIGKKKKPHYRIVAIDSRASRDGKYIEKLGNYNPLVNPPEIIVDEEKALKETSHNGSAGINRKLEHHATLFGASETDGATA